MRWRLAVKITLVAAIVILLPACRVKPKPGAATPDRVIEQYLLALAAKDERSIEKLVPENYVATTEIQTKIRQFGGHKIQGHQFIYTKTKPTLWGVKITGFYFDRNGRQSKFEDKITIIYQDRDSWKLYQGRWYLLLGKSQITAP
jgi:hypothetical protein